MAFLYGCPVFQYLDFLSRSTKSLPEESLVKKLTRFVDRRSIVIRQIYSQILSGRYIMQRLGTHLHGIRVFRSPCRTWKANPFSNYIFNGFLK